MHNTVSISMQHCNSHKTIVIIIIFILTAIITITTVINFNRYLLKRLNTIFEKLSFSGSRPITKYDSVTIYDSLDYYTSRQPVITIYDRCVITIHDRYYNTSVITIRNAWIRRTKTLT